MLYGTRSFWVSMNHTLMDGSLMDGISISLSYGLIDVLRRLLHKFSLSFFISLIILRVMVINQVLKRYLAKRPIFLCPISKLYSVVRSRYSCDSSVLIASPPSLSLNFNFRHQLSNQKIRNLLSFVDSNLCIFIIHFPGYKSSLTPSGPFSNSSFVKVISVSANLISFPPTNFNQKSKASLKVKAFAWLVANMKVNSNDFLYKRRSHKDLRPKWCIMHRSGEFMEHLFCIALQH